VDKTISQIATKEVAPHTVLVNLITAQCLGQCFDINEYSNIIKVVKQYTNRFQQLLIVNNSFCIFSI